MIAAVGRIYEWEIAKLLAQKRTYLGLIAATLVPIVFVVVLVFQTGGPNDVPLGRYIRDTGLATPFVVLFFMSIWGFPLITALVAGDIVASESQHGTLKTILTRSRERGPKTHRNHGPRFHAAVDDKCAPSSKTPHAPAPRETERV